MGVGLCLLRGDVCRFFFLISNIVEGGFVGIAWRWRRVVSANV
jgi:hypothetical protein